MGRIQKRRIKAEMNVVPYIDVMLVLLVIFMIATPLMQRSIEVDLPQVAEEDSKEKPSREEDLTLPLILSVDVQGKYYLNISENPSASLAPEEIEQIGRKYLVAHPQIEVYVRGDSAVSYARIIEGMGYLKAAGAGKVNLSTQLPQDDDAP